MPEEISFLLVADCWPGNENEIAWGLTKFWIINFEMF